LHQIEGISANAVKLVQFFQFLKSCANFAIFTPYERVLGVDYRSEFFFNISRDFAMATNLAAKNGAKLPTALIALSFRYGMGYRYLNERVNSINDASKSCYIFLKFSPVTSELTGLICER